MQRTIYNQFEVDSAHHEITIKVTDGANVIKTITNTHLKAEAFTYHSALCTNGLVNFGECVANELEFEVEKSMGADLLDKRLWVTIFVDGMIEEQFYNLGEFVVVSSTKSDKTHYRIFAKDMLALVLDEPCNTWLNTLTFPMTMGEFREELFDKLYTLTNGGILQESVTLPCDDVPIRKPFSNDKSDHTMGELLQGICGINGLFGKLVPEDNAYGNIFHYVKLGEVTRELYTSNCSEIDVDEQYTPGVSILEYHYYGNLARISAAGFTDPDGRSPIKLIIKNNPFMLVLGTGSQPYYLPNTVPLNVLDNLALKPIQTLSAETYGNPSYWVGDKLLVSANGTEYESYMIERTIKGIQHMRDYITVETMNYPTQKDTISQIQDDIINLQLGEQALNSSVSNLNTNVTNLNNGKLDKTGGTVSGTLNVSGGLSEGGTPLSNKYQPKGNYLPTSGGTISGDLTVTGSISEGGTSLPDKYLSKSGGTVSGKIDISAGNTIARTTPTSQDIVIYGVSQSEDVTTQPGIGFYIHNKNWGMLKFREDGSVRLYNNNYTGYLPFLLVLYTKMAHPLRISIKQKVTMHQTY